MAQHTEINRSVLITTVIGAFLISFAGTVVVLRDGQTELKVRLETLGNQVSALTASNQEVSRRLLELERKK